MTALRGDLAQLLRFGVVGVAATLTNFVVTVLAIERLGLAPPVAATLAVLVAFGVSYGGHRGFTFRAPRDHRRHLPRFLLAQGAIFALCLAFTGWANDTLHWHHRWVAATVCVLWPLLSFFVARRWVFAPPRPALGERAP